MKAITFIIVRWGRARKCRYYAGKHGWKDDKTDFNVIRYFQSNEARADMRKVEREQKLRPYALELGSV